MLRSPVRLTALEEGAYGRERPFGKQGPNVGSMSALPPLADIAGCDWDVRLCLFPTLPVTNCWSSGSFGSCSVIHRPNCVMLKLTLENLNFAPLVSRLARMEAR